MSEIVQTLSIRLELDKAFQYAVTLAWEDLMKPTEPRSVRVEYLCEPGTPLDYVSIWSSRARGYQDLVCDYWTWTSPAHPSGVRFTNKHSSDKLAEALDFIMKNQGRFTRPADTGRHGLVQIHPPDADDSREAANWMKEVQEPQSQPDAGEVAILPEDYRQDEQASSRMDDDGTPANVPELCPMRQNTRAMSSSP